MTASASPSPTPFTTDGDEAANLLAETIGVEPTATTIAGSHCQAPTTVYDWGGFALDVPGVITTAPGAQFSATITAATTSTGLALEGPGAQQVGGFIAMSIASPPGTSAGSEWGVYGGLSSGALAFMISPVYIFGDC